MTKREPIFTKSGRVVMVSLVLTFAIVAGVRTMGYDNSALGILGVLFATHIVGGIAQVILQWQAGEEAYYAEQEKQRLWRLSHPDPFAGGDYAEHRLLSAPSEVHPQEIENLYRQSSASIAERSDYERRHTERLTIPR